MSEVITRTGVESLQHIIQEAKAGRIGPKAEAGEPAWECCYTYPSGNHCAVGCLLTQEQLKAIFAAGDNDFGILIVTAHAEHEGDNRITRKSIERTTGLKLKQLWTLQKIHDDPNNESRENRADRLVAACERAIEAGFLGNIPLN